MQLAIYVFIVAAVFFALMLQSLLMYTKRDDKKSLGSTLIIYTVLYMLITLLFVGLGVYLLLNKDWNYYVIFSSTKGLETVCGKFEAAKGKLTGFLKNQ
jgi:hypothetical protein